MDVSPTPADRPEEPVHLPDERDDRDDERGPDASSPAATPEEHVAGPREGPPTPEPRPPGDPAARVREPQIDLDLFLRRIRERKIYPLAARRRGYEGRVVIRLRLDREGNAADIAVLESSGHRVLDRAALSLVEEALPFRHGAGREVVLDVPVQYSLVE